MFCPKHSHEFALKSIGFLKARHLRRIILDLSSNPKIDCNPDAYFAGMNGNEKITYLACMKSRTGYIINVGSCPVLWQSKFRIETVLSTTEAEVIALAHSCIWLHLLVML